MSSKWVSEWHEKFPKWNHSKWFGSIRNPNDSKWFQVIQSHFRINFGIDLEILHTGQTGKEHKISQYADDTSLILDGSPNSLFTAFNTLQFFPKLSGLKVKSSKTKNKLDRIKQIFKSDFSIWMKTWLGFNDI